MTTLPTTNYKLGASRGFTIVEMLISMTLFLVIVGISIGGFVRALRAQQNIISLIASNDNASLSLEQMARELRTGKALTVTPPSTLRFQLASGQTVTYSLNNNQLMREIGGVSSVITASNVFVHHLNFYLTTSDINGRPTQPRITITIRVSSPKRDIRDVYTDLQTTISPRVLN